MSHERLMQLFVLISERASRRVVANGYLRVHCLLLVGRDAQFPAQRRQTASESLIAFSAFGLSACIDLKLGPLARTYLRIGSTALGIMIRF